MMARAGRVLFCLLLTLGASDLTWAKRYGAVEFEECRLPTPAGTQSPSAFCTRLEVPENWNKPNEKPIELAVAWLPARAKKPLAAPVVLIAGGPGQAARESFSSLLPAYRPIREEHHLLLVDQRGTGASAPIRCPATTAKGPGKQSPELIRKWAEDCIAQHSESHDLSQYHTESAIKDLDAVRQALGIKTWNMLGVSYGTRVVQRYARRFPDTLHHLVLDGVIPDDVPLGAEDEINLERAIQAQLERCSDDESCTTRFGSPYGNLNDFAETLSGEDLRVQVRHPRTGARLERPLNRAVLGSWIRVMAYAPELIPLIPWTLEQAQQGDAAPLVAQAWMIEEMLEKQISMGMQLSVICNEQIPPPVNREITEPKTRALFQRDAALDLRALCELWPKSSQQPKKPPPGKIQAATLLLSGQYDPVTPPTYGERAAADFSRARHLVLQGQTHGVSAIGCTPQVIADFLAEGRPDNVDDTCLERLEAPPFFLHAQGTAP